MFYFFIVTIYNVTVGDCMNIFYIHEDPIIAAKMMTNKHVVKMIIESAQLLSTAHRVLDGYLDSKISSSGKRIVKCWKLNSNLDNILYSSTHYNHPSSIWARKSEENYIWLYNHFLALGNEYTYRYNKIHKTIEKLKDALKTPPVNISNEPFTPPFLALPKTYITSCSTYSSDRNMIIYRDYYISEKLKTDSDFYRFNSYITV